MKLIVLPYKESSKGAARLAGALHLQTVLKDQRFTANEPTRVLNWGRGDYPAWYKTVGGWINNPQSVMNAINKATALRIFADAGVPTVATTTDRAVAERWLREGAVAVFCRQDLEGREGNGIVVARRRDQLVAAKLYTKYERKRNEYRVHVMNGEVFYYNVKRKKEHMPAGAEELIRSGANGWFLAELDTPPTNRRIGEACVAAVRALGLDFGGVDIGEAEDGSVRVYEVNTAPELGPNTTAAYLRAFKKHYGLHKNNDNVRISTI